MIRTLIVFGLALTTPAWVCGQTPAPPESTATPPVAVPTASSATDTSQTKLRRSDQPSAPAPVPAPEAVKATPAPAAAPVAKAPAPTAAPAPVAPATEPLPAVAPTQPGEAPVANKDDRSAKRRHGHRGQGDEFPLGDHTVPAGSSVGQVVSIRGNSVLDGDSDDQVVSVYGDTTVNGKAGGQAVAVVGNVVVNGEVGQQVVAVVGDATINGEVGQQVVAVLGNVTLGPKAVVHGDVVTVGGQLHRDDGAVVNGNVQVVSFLGHGTHLDGLRSWIHHCLMLGRPLAFRADLGWAWMIAGAVFAFYILLALLFPRAFVKCAETLEQRPGHSLLAVLLTVLITPVLVVLLVVTGIGIILIPFVVAAVFFGSIFGKAIMHAWLGRRITRYFGEGPMQHVAMATLVGGGLLLLLYTVPFLGFFVWKVFDVIGLGVVIYTLILAMRREKPVRPAPVSTVAAAGVAGGTGVAAAAAMAPTGAEASAATTASPAAVATVPAAETQAAVVPPIPPVSPQALLAAPPAPLPPPLPVAALPRAGFWIRIAASLIDAVVIGLVVGLLHVGSWFVILYMAYCVVLWAKKGTTVGGIVCGLKVVRLDDRPLDWSVAIVRALGGFLSLAVAGLGFVWVAFDPEKQSWHDKIAGTVVACVPKGTPLI